MDNRKNSDYLHLKPHRIITVYDAAGQLVMQDRISLESDALNISRLQPGVYILKAENSAGKFSQKLIVTK